MESCSSLSHTTTNTQKTPRFWLLRPRFFALRFWCPCPALFLINFHLPVRNIQLEPRSRLGPLPTGHAPLLETHSGSSPSCWCRTICFPWGLMFYRGFLLFSHFFLFCSQLQGFDWKPRQGLARGLHRFIAILVEGPVNLRIIAFGLKDVQSPWRSWMGVNCFFPWKMRRPQKERLKRDGCI